MINKKYFSIDEVANIIGVKAYKLRYLEKSTPQIEVFRIRGRRYYSRQNIDQIRQILNLNENDNAKEPSDFPNQVIINKVDNLIAKFKTILLS